MLWRAGGEQRRRAGPGHVSKDVGESPRGSLVRRGRLIPLALAVAGFLLVVGITSPHGPALYPDSVTYLSIARALARSCTYENYQGSPCPEWPPLFPAVLALLSRLGVDPIHGSRYLNAIAFGLTVGLLTAWTWRRTGALLAGLLSGSLVLGSAALIGVAVVVSTEPLFVLFLMFALTTLDALLLAPGTKRAALAGMAVGAACLTRYIGFSAVLAGALLLAIARGLDFRRRLLLEAVFLAVAVGPICGWLIRNAVVAGSMVGVRGASAEGPLTAASALGKTLWNWFLPWRFVLAVPGPALSLLMGVLLLALLLAAAHRYRKSGTGGLAPALLVCAALALAYLATLFGAASSAAMEPIGDRFLAPVTVPLFAIVVFLAFGCWAGPRRERTSARAGIRRGVLRSLAVAYALVLLTVAGMRLAQQLPPLLSGQALFFASPAWQSSPTIQLVKGLPLRAPIMSNGPEALYLLAGKRAHLTPRETYYQSRDSVIAQDLSECDRLVAEAGGGTLIWFDKIRRGYLWREESLRERYDLRLAAELPDGRIYEFPGRQ